MLQGFISIYIDIYTNKNSRILEIVQKDIYTNIPNFSRLRRAKMNFIYYKITLEYNVAPQAKNLHVLDSKT